MIKSIVVIFALLFFFNSGAEAQTIAGKIEQLAKDPKTAEQAAKADVYIVGHKIWEEPAIVNSNNQKQAIPKKKRKGCKKK